MTRKNTNRRLEDRLNLTNLRLRFGSTKLATAAIRGALTLVALSALLLFAVRPVQGQTETVLYSFGSQYQDAVSPFSGLVLDKRGNIYGTTEGGGTYFGGTVFELTPGGTEQVLYTFGPYPEGSSPSAGVILDKDGYLYGTTYLGGPSDKGTVFKLSPTGIETVLYSFGSQSGDGRNPYAGLVLDKQGNLYGTTEGDFGTVFKVTPAGAETVLHSFGSQSDGYGVYSGLVVDKQGNFYGTTCGGGANNAGTVFKLTPTGAETVLYSFGSQPGDGTCAYAGLVLDHHGNLYGTTLSGGDYGWGTVFRLTVTGTEIVLYSFGSHSGDGHWPYASLVLDRKGDLYGTTSFGGPLNEGTIFELTPDGRETVLYSFGTQSGDGIYPFGSLVQDKNGNFYGTTSQGGAHLRGTVFQLTP